MAKVVIIGAGLTGLSTAYHLEKKGFFDYTIVEKEHTVGGLCRSVAQDGFTFDYTGHLLHINNPYFKSLIESITKPTDFNKIVRKSYIFSHGVYTHYPFQINLHGLPETVITDCIEGFVARSKSSKKTQTYYQWVMQNFGRGFGKHFFLPYQRKIFTYDPRKFTGSWTGRFVPSTSLGQIVRGALSPPTEEKIGYNATFLYPKQGGVSFWVNRLANQIINPITTNCCVKSIDLKNKVVYFTNGNLEPFEKLVSTMPLDMLLRYLKEKSSTTLRQAQKYLLCNSVLNLNLGIARPNLSQKNWIYYPEKKFPFYRVGFWHTFSKHMVPPGCSSLYGELAYLNKSKQFVQQTLHETLANIKKLFGIDDKEIITQKNIHLRHAYVIYNTWREKHLPSVHQRLIENNVHSIGRYGAWKYSSMQEAVLDGKQMAHTLTTTTFENRFFVTSTKTQKKEKSHGKILS